MDPVRPTVVVGVGEAGWSMVDDISQVVEEQLGDAAEVFDYVMIDTNGSDMRSDGPLEKAYPVTIEKPPDEWETDKDNFHYLSDTLDPLNSGDKGAIKQRPLGRYQIEKQGQRQKVLEQLRGEITTHMNEIDAVDEDYIRSRNDLSIWLVNSLGGGTGSGTFPVIAEIIAEIIDNDLPQTNTYFFGIGGTPETERDTSDKTSLPEPEHRMNTYTALRELLSIVRPEQSEKAGEPVRFPEDSLYDERDRLVGNPFTKYFLLGHDPEEAGDRYLQQINRVAGILITYLSQTGGLEDFPAVNVTGDDDTLWAVDAYQIHAPVSETGAQVGSEDRSVESIVNYLENIENTNEKIEEHKQRKEKLKETRKFINNLDPDERNYASFGADKLAEETNIPPDFLGAFESSTAELAEQDIYTDRDGKIFDIDEEIEQHAAEDEITTYLEGDIQEDTFDQLIKFVYATYLQIRIEKLQNNHEFYEEMEEEWNNLARHDKIDPRDDTVGTFNQYGDDPLEAYRNEIRDALEEIKDDYDKKAEEQGSLGSIIGTDWAAERDKKERQIENYDEHRNKYNILRDVRQTASSRAKTAWQELDARADELSDEIENIKNTIDDLQSKIEGDLKDIRRTLEEVQEESNEDRYHRLPLTELDVPSEFETDDSDEVDQVSEQAQTLYSQYDSINQLISDHIDPDNVGTAARQVLGNLATPTVQNENTEEVETVLNITAGPGDASAFKETQINEQETVEDRIDLAGEFDSSEQEVESTDGFSVWTLGLYTNLTAEDMYEVAYFDDNFTAEKKNVGETPLGLHHPDEVTDRELAARFAYPEFLSEEYEQHVRELADTEPSPSLDDIEKHTPNTEG